jgi:hypothetical protein
MICIPCREFILYFFSKYCLNLGSGPFLRPLEGQKLGSSFSPKTALISARDILVSPLTSCKNYWFNFFFFFCGLSTLWSNLVVSYLKLQ